MTPTQVRDMNIAGARRQLKRLQAQVTASMADLDAGEIPSGRLADAAIAADTHTSVLGALTMLED